MQVPVSYIPILSGRAGEMDALREAKLGPADAITPLIDLAAVRRSLPTANGPVKDADPAGTLCNRLARLASVVGTSRRVIVDIEGYSKFHRPAGVHAIEYLAGEVKRRGLRVCLAVSSTASSEYVETAVAHGDAWRGYLIRLSEPGGKSDEKAHALCDRLETSPMVTDLLLDVGPIQNVDLTVASLAAFANPGDVRTRWGSTALASTALPDWSTIKKPVDGKSYRRVDREVWLQLRSEIGLSLGYSDYGIAGPRVDTDEPVGNPAPHLRYTERDDVWVWRGRKPQEGGGQPGITYAELCDSLERIRNRKGRNVFRGSVFSWGDGRIADTIRTRSAGAPRTWIANSTSHHLRQIQRELSSL